MDLISWSSRPISLHSDLFREVVLPDCLFHIRHPRIPLAIVVRVVQVPVKGLNQSVSQVFTISERGTGSATIMTMGNRFIILSLLIFKIGFLPVSGLVGYWTMECRIKETYICQYEKSTGSRKSSLFSI
jgi:hypothetical protein